jgi:hypothetical protein
MEKKAKLNFKKRFAFTKPFQPRPPEYTLDNMNAEMRDFWKPSLELFNGKKKIILQSSQVLSLEEIKAMPVKPFQNAQVIMK